MASFKGPSRKFFARFESVKKKHLKIEPFLVTTSFDSKSKATISSAQQRRLDDVATGIIDQFEDLYHKEILKADAYIDKLLKAVEGKGEGDHKKARDAANKTAENTIKTIRGSDTAMKKMINNGVVAALKKEKIFKELDTEFKIGVVYKVGKSAISVTTSIAATVVTPVNPKAWYAIGKGIYDAGKVIHDAAKDEETIRNQVHKALHAHLEKLAKDADPASKDERKWYSFLKSRKDTGKKLEQVRQRYDVDLGKKLKQVDAASSKLDKARKVLNKELKSLPAGLQLKYGVKVGKKLMDVQRLVSGYAKALNEQRKFADSMAELIGELGVEVDRISYQEKGRQILGGTRSLPSPTDIYKVAKRAYDDVKEVQGMIEAIQKAVESIA